MGGISLLPPGRSQVSSAARRRARSHRTSVRRIAAARRHAQQGGRDGHERYLAGTRRAVRAGAVRDGARDERGHHRRVAPVVRRRREPRARSPARASPGRSASPPSSTPRATSGCAGRAATADAAALVTGSHADSVPHGGNYDGLAGIVAGLVVARRLHDEAPGDRCATTSCWRCGPRRARGSASPTSVPRHCSAG